MERIKKVYRDTGKKCSCGSNIVESFSTKYGEWNGIIGPGSHRPSWVASDGFHCNDPKCGLQYGEPRFFKTEPTAQIKFELTLLVATLKKKIATDDMMPHLGLTKGRTVRTKIGNLILKGKERVLTERKTALPSELRKKPIGAIVFILPSEDPHYDPSGYVTVQLSEKIGSPMFSIKSHCIE